MKTWSYAASIVVFAAGSVIVFGQKTKADEQRIDVTFTGGFDLDRRDRGRPVALIAAALGVPDQVFRGAFSHVRPAPAGTEPDQNQVRQNKDALLNALGKYGITNDRLDQVSNYYRYNGSRGEWWPYKLASGYAIVSHGLITKFVITNPGAGYSSAPRVSVPGFPNVTPNVTMSYGRDLRTNGSVASITPPK